MADEGNREAAEPVEESPGGRPPSRMERLFMRVSVWQTVLSVAGVFIGIVALYAALSESEAVRKQTAATVWPYVQLLVEDYADDEAAGFSMTLANAGVGPARVRALELRLGGTPMRDWDQAVGQVTGGEPVEFGRNFIVGRVLTPGESVALIHTHDPSLVAAFRAAVADPSSALRYCYCSIFDDCWLRDSRDEAADPEPVESCPDFGKGAFVD